ncbi:hypothetical protein [Streptomyces sp. NPDC002054]|uniref:effector-associated constant component EACC1 n=1 Tax=Streptomyces sp. NPDC002054 TaxID=3154663 RepID=UPI00332F9FAE
MPDGLRRFLAQDPGFRTHGRARWEPSEPAREGQLGTGLEVLTLVITGVLALPAAIDTVRRWCASPGPGRGVGSARSWSVWAEPSPPHASRLSRRPCSAGVRSASPARSRAS